MQYAVPQFTEIEDKLIGPLTLKQFLIFLAAGGIILLFYSLLGVSLFFFIFSFPFAILGLALAFGTFNGRPLFGLAMPIVSFFSKPQVRIFKRLEPDMVIRKARKPTEPTQADKLSGLETESRLKKLAYLLDQKVHEEEELVGHVTRNM